MDDNKQSTQPIFKLKTVSRATGKGYTEQLPQTEIVETLLSYLALSLVRGEGLKITASDDEGELIKVETSSRTVEDCPAELKERDILEVIQAVSEAEQAKREGKPAPKRIIIARNPTIKNNGHYS